MGGTLTYTVREGVVKVFRGAADDHPRLVRKVRAGQTGTVRAGEWVIERPHDVHFGANETDRPVVILLATLFKTGSPAAIPVPEGTSTGSRARRAAAARRFAGYWMGIDPLDGGDSRRGITRKAGGRFALIGRDTVFTLCDGTDRAIVTAGDLAVSGSSLVSDDFLISCTNNNSTIRLKVRYDVIGRNIIRETLTTQGGEPVDKIIFHRVSER